jgi:hypothetical protein
MDRFLDFQYAMAVEEFNYYMSDELDSAMEANIGELIKNIGKAISKAAMFAIKKIIGLLKAARDGVKRVIGKIKGKVNRPTKDLRDGIGRPLGGIALSEKAGPNRDVVYRTGLPFQVYIKAGSAVRRLLLLALPVSEMLLELDRARFWETADDVDEAVEEISGFKEEINSKCKELIDELHEPVDSEDPRSIGERVQNGSLMSPDALLKALDTCIADWTEKGKKVEQAWHWIYEDPRYDHETHGSAEYMGGGAQLKTAYNDIQQALTSCVNAASTMSSYINENIVTKAAHMTVIPRSEPIIVD